MPHFKCTQEHIRGTRWQFVLLQTIFSFIVLQFVGQENLIYSSYHRNWTVLVSPQYFWALNRPYLDNSMLMYLFCALIFKILLPQENVVSWGLQLKCTSYLHTCYEYSPPSNFTDPNFRSSLLIL